jgi:hypothetical protein
MIRIKTEQELIKTYGDNWRNSVPYGWNYSMSTMLGMEIPEKDYNLASYEGELNYSNFVGTFHHSVLTTKEKPSYMVVSAGLHKQAV